MAINCRVVPVAMLGLVGVIAMDTRVPGVTVRVVDAEMFLNAAVIVVEPTAREMACPWEPAVLLIDATPVLEELQVVCAVRSCVVLSENVPMAVNCWVEPLAIPGLAGVIAIDASLALEIVTLPLP